MEKEAQAYTIDKVLIVKLWHKEIVVDNVVQASFMFFFLFCIFFL